MAVQELVRVYCDLGLHYKDLAALLARHRCVHEKPEENFEVLCRRSTYLLHNHMLQRALPEHPEVFGSHATVFAHVNVYGVHPKMSPFMCL